MSERIKVWHINGGRQVQDTAKKIFCVVKEKYTTEKRLKILNIFV
jgi:hypothetical protein